nr:MAG TPA: hypothetical protein [Caudoviricetes sp.]DAX36035.1 MAG TPA: hypothetical protein [Caudoviricetes sp.]DAY25092.1 MAG TPA: hypothetical protein [Caudoviricetes sp.]
MRRNRAQVRNNIRGIAPGSMNSSCTSEGDTSSVVLAFV